jgi:2-polyprenyl-3-methyl-5-hydroxy-6-metoxy-1,4-benzoquinol methylase
LTRRPRRFSKADMSTAASSIDPADVARFSAIAESWWDP